MTLLDSFNIKLVVPGYIALLARFDIFMLNIAGEREITNLEMGNSQKEEYM